MLFLGIFYMAIYMTLVLKLLIPPATPQQPLFFLIETRSSDPLSILAVMKDLIVFFLIIQGLAIKNSRAGTTPFCFLKCYSLSFPKVVLTFLIAFPAVQSNTEV